MTDSKTTTQKKTGRSEVTEEVRFTRPHRHRGKDYKAGDTAHVTARERDKLAKLGVIAQ